MEIERAAAEIRAGRLAAFPTETVYGLGANALDERAVAEIFRVKGRPATSPLIVHVADLAMARELSSDWPEAAERLAGAFWPGPLTLVVAKSPQIPDLVTAGLPNVGLRIPAHPVALALLREAGVPIAAPSANRFTELSPTTADHVRQSFGEAVPVVLDGGPCQVGIESTVLSLVGGKAVLLRPGMVQQAEIEKIIGPVTAGVTPDGAHASPGQHRRHYQPSTRLFLLGPGQPLPAGRGAYIWINEERPVLEKVNLTNKPNLYAAQLYDTLHALDQRHFEWIAVEDPGDSPAWAGIRDRLQRASAV